MLDLTPDELLTTTRSVRKRLDFDRPVPRAVLVECIEIALQAPTGSNRQGWQWMFVDDPAKKEGLAELYNRHAQPYFRSPQPQYNNDDTRRHRMRAVASSAMYLAEHMHRAPWLLVPIMEGRPDVKGGNFALASQYGSILPAVWSFMLALRARGLGSSWTTLHLGSEREAAELLGIDYDSHTQVGLFPVGFTKGTDFKRAPRLPAEELIHWNTW